MHNESQKALTALRLDRAAECLKDAELMLDAGSYKGVANRSYYCVFHAMRAVLANDDFDSRKHSGIISAFRERYIKTGIFPKEFSDTIRDAFDNRGQSDYDDFYVISKAETAEQIEKAKIFLAAVEEYIKAL